MVSTPAIKNDIELLALKEIQGITGLKSMLSDYESMLFQTNEYAGMNKELLIENASIKERNASLEHEIDMIRCQSTSGAEEEILKRK